MNPESNSQLLTCSAEDIEKCVEWIERRSLERVCLQFPDDLLAEATEIALKLEESLKKKTYILGDTTSGSCCVDEIAANHVNADGIIHFGHACLNPTIRLPVFHVLPKRLLQIDNFCNDFEQMFHDLHSTIILFYDVTYAHLIENIFLRLKRKYTNLIISKLNSTSTNAFTDAEENSNMVILGRTFKLENGYRIEDYTAVFLGENIRTLFTLAMSLPARSWYHSEGNGNGLEEFNSTSNSWIKRRRYLIEKLKDAQTVGIVIANLNIKDYLEVINAVKKIFKAKNKKSYLLCVGKINVAKLSNFPEIDAFVVITCPEDEVYDSREFFKPILTPFEVELAFNVSRSGVQQQHCMDFRQMLRGGFNYVDFETSNESDVSLISGNIRNVKNESLDCNEMNALATTDNRAVAIGKAGANFLINRSWQGVEQRLGKDSVEPAQMGRRGLPVNYESEPVTKNV